jgi:class 3 adenylate cyclase
MRGGPTREQSMRLPEHSRPTTTRCSYAGKFHWLVSQRKLAAILAADVVGYSRLMGRRLVESPQRLALTLASPETSTCRGSSPPTQR